MKSFLLIVFFPVIRLSYWLSGFFPRRGNLWAFGSYSNTFTDNSKYLYTYVTEHHPEIDCVWITANSAIRKDICEAGGKAYERWSLAGVFYSLRAKYWFVSSYVSDINYYASRGACLVNLWHGIPLKKIEFDIERGPLAQRFRNPTFLERHLFYASLYRKPDWVLSTSEFVTNASFASAFRIQNDKCVSLGYPRLDSFFWSTEQRLKWVRRWGSTSMVDLIQRLPAYRKIYFYMPTWRDSDPDFLENAGLDFHQIDRELKQRNALLMLKLHLATPTRCLDSLRSFANIHVMDTRDDIYPLLPQSSALVTDYSSIYLDYLLLDRPVCFFVFDISRYLTESRGFYHSFDDFSPGVKAHKAAQVSDFIKSDGFDDFQVERGQLRDQLYEHSDGESSRRIVEFIKSQYKQS